MSLIIEMLQNSCRKYAKKTALRYKVAGCWTEYSYEQLWQASDHVAAGLSEWGIDAGERAALLAPSSPAWVATYFGIIKSNAIVVPVDKDLKQGELRHILSDCGARVLFTEQPFLETVYDIAESLPSLEKIVLLNHTPTPEGPLPTQAEHVLTELVMEWRRLSRRYRIKDADVKKFENLAEGFQELIVPTMIKQDEGKKNFFSRLLHARDKELPLFDVESLEDFQR
ncbi:MAG: AMP-binding protein, partial [Desulfuromonadales bacterium]